MIFTSQKVRNSELLSKSERKQSQDLKLLNGLIKFSLVILRRTLLHSLSMLVKESKMQRMTDIREDRILLIQLLKVGCCSNQGATRKTDPEKETSKARSI